MAFLVTVNECAVYCAFVKRWPSRQARQIYSGCKRQQFANPALDLNSSEISYVRNSGYRAGPDETFWSASGTPKTHLVPPFCGAGAAAVATKHFLSASVTVRPLLVMSPYLSAAFIEGDVTGKNPCLYRFIKRGS